MTRDEWRRVEPVLTRALLLPEGDRSALLDTVGLEDVVRRRIEEVLRQSSTRTPNVAAAGGGSGSPPGGGSGMPPGGIPSSPLVPVLTPGDTLDGGRFVVVRQIGRGGMGDVYLAQDTTLGTLVALKVLPSDERLITEAQRAAVCSGHANVVTVHNVLRTSFKDLPIGVLVMDYVAGTPASNVLDDGPVELARALRWMREVAAAVAHAHHCNVLHCDLKPANILITPDDHAMVLDFGIARATFDATNEAEPLRGTLPYMAPEQFLAREFSPAGDIYSLGVTLFELVTGRRPFDGDDEVMLRLQIIAADPPKMSEFAPGVTPELDAIVQRTLAKDPDERYRSARAFDRALERNDPSQSGTVPTPTPPAPPPTPTPVTIWSKVGVASACLTALVAALTAIGALTSAVFNMTLERAGFENETILDWFVWGRRATFTTFAWLVILGIAVVPFVVVRRVALSVSATAERVDAAVADAIRRLRVRLGLGDPAVNASYLLVFFGAVLASACVYFWPFISAFMDFVSRAPAEKLALLADDDAHVWYHSFYRGAFTTIVIAMAAAWGALVSSLPRRQRLHPGVIAAGAAMMVASVVLQQAPYRLVSYRQQYEVALWNSERCFIIGERPDVLLLFCPELPAPRNRRVKRDDPGITRTGMIESDLFSYFSKTAREES